MGSEVQHPVVECRTQFRGPGPCYGVWHRQWKLWDQAAAVGWGRDRWAAIAPVLGALGRTLGSVWGGMPGISPGVSPGFAAHLPTPGACGLGSRERKGQECPVSPGAAQGVHAPGTRPLPPQDEPQGTENLPAPPGNPPLPQDTWSGVRSGRSSAPLGPGGLEFGGPRCSLPSRFAPAVPVPVPAGDFAKRLARG